MKKTNIVIISLCLSVLILSSVVHADVIFVPGPFSDDVLNLLVIIAAIIGIIAIFAWRMIRKIKKNNDSKREPKTRA